MGIVKKQGGLSTIIIYIGAILGYVNVALLLPNYFTAEEIGLRALLVDFATIFSQIALVGFPTIFLRYYTHFKNENGKIEGLFGFVFIVPLFVFSILAFVLYLFQTDFLNWYSSDSTLLREYFYLVYLLCLFYVINGLLEAYCRSFLSITYTSFVREIFTRILFTLCVLLYVFQCLNLKMFFIFFIASYGVNSILLLIHIYNQGQLNFSIDKRFFEKTFLKEIILFALFTSATSVAGMLMTKIDNVMLGNMMGLKEVGIYSLCVFIVAVIEFPKRAFSMINIPLFTQYWKENDMTSIQNLYQKTGEVLTVVSLFIFGGIVINLNEIFEIIPKGEIYSLGKYVVMVLGFSKVLDMSFSSNAELLFPTKYYKNLLYFILVLMVLALSTNYIFIKKIGISGAAFGTMISLFVYNVSICVFIYKKWGFLPFTKQSVLSTFLFLVLIGVFYHVDFELNKYVDIAIRSSLFSLIVFLTVYYTNISVDIRDMLRKMLSKII